MWGIMIWRVRVPPGGRGREDMGEVEVVSIGLSTAKQLVECSFFLNMHVAHDTDGAKKCMKHTTFNTWNSWNC